MEGWESHDIHEMAPQPICRPGRLGDDPILDFIRV